MLAYRSEQKRVPVDVILRDLIHPGADEIRVQPRAASELIGKMGRELSEGHEQVVELQLAAVARFGSAGRTDGCQPQAAILEPGVSTASTAWSDYL
jgi:hypothetical protein